MLTPSSRLAALAAASAITLVLVAFAVQRQAPPASADEPVITYMYPEDGDVFSEPLQVIQVCFENPIDVRDLPSAGGEGEFEFDLNRPSGLGVGMRIVFQADGYGVAVYPGIETEGIEGEWTFRFQVRDRQSLDRIDRTIRYTVESGGEPIITPTPQFCPSGGGTFAPTSSPTPGPDATPGNGGVIAEEDGESDALELPLLVVAVAGGAAVLLLLGYLFRRRIGWWLHNPADEPGPGDHH